MFLGLCCPPGLSQTLGQTEVLIFKLLEVQVGSRGPSRLILGA